VSCGNEWASSLPPTRSARVRTALTTGDGVSVYTVPRVMCCSYPDCPEWARGYVWPFKRTGEPMTPPYRACVQHLEMAQAAGQTIRRDAERGH
jgi:hypothetical protein